MTHEVHDTHFINNEHLVDDNEALDKILSLSKELDKVHKESLAIELPIPGGGLSYSSALKTTLIFMIIFMVVISIMMICRSVKDTKRHRRVLETVTDGIYGQGTYSISRQERKRRDSYSIDMTKLFRNMMTPTATATSPAQVNVMMSPNQGPQLPDRNNPSQSA